MTPTSTATGHTDVTTTKRLLRYVAENAFDEPTSRPAAPPATLGAKLAATIPGQPTVLEPSVPICDIPRGKVVIEPEEAALRTARRWQEPSDRAIGVYSDGFRLDNGS
jgi:hypothetical protein